MEYDKVRDDDWTTIALQLGREPRGVLGVNLRCPYGFPQVITNRPVMAEPSDVRVFPTLFWLTCPYLKRRVAQLESEGAVVEFEERIAEDEEFAARVRQDHDSYAELRSSLIPDDVQERLVEDYPKRAKVIATTGVGGSRNEFGVKCLHMHLADYLARGQNAIGEETASRIGLPLYCDSGDCEKEL